MELVHEASFRIHFMLGNLFYKRFVVEPENLLELICQTGNFEM
jgi:hypothetical protein